MTPEARLAEAERLIEIAGTGFDARDTAIRATALVHATIAQAGFLRDLPYNLMEMGVGVRPQ